MVPDTVANNHLRTESCEDLERERAQAIEDELGEMRKAIAQSLRDWRAEQKGCWQEYRHNANLWEDGIGEVFGVGGLGLSGIGEGGGGQGEGIRLGSIGTMGHGAGVGMGFGSGQGRLSGSHSTSQPRIRSSMTNVQVEGVDEADIVKSDGNYVYLALNGALRIATVTPPQLLSVTPLKGRVKELFVQGKRAVVYVAQGGSAEHRCTYAYDCEIGGDGSQTRIVVFDVSTPAAPRIRRQFQVSGALIAARRIGDTVHTVVVEGERPKYSYSVWPNGLPRCGVQESAVRAQFDRLTRKNERQIRMAHGLPTLMENGLSRRFCSTLWRSRLDGSNAFTTLYSFDLKDDQSKVVGSSLESQPGTVYAGPESLYLAVKHGKGWNMAEQEVSEIHKFRIGSKPEVTRYLASGAVAGHVINQFAMDEWRGDLRIATTRGRVPNPNVESQLSVLAEQSGSLVRIGAVEHLAPTEDIRSVRFDAERAYVVTFKKTDPLFVLDLSRPGQPRLLGELKIPGFSTYLHRLDSNHLLSIGFDADDQGDFAYFNGILLQLFDVTRPTDPKLLYREKIGSRGSASEAATNHLAFNFLPEAGLLAIPMTICDGGGNGRMGDRLSFAGLLIYDVNLSDGFHQRGGISHGKAGSSCNTWWSKSSSTVKRSLFLDDQVWSIAMDRAKVQRLTRLGHDLADIRLN
jgi:hypothetical protein